MHIDEFVLLVRAQKKAALGKGLIFKKLDRAVVGRGPPYNLIAAPVHVSGDQY